MRVNIGSVAGSKKNLHKIPRSITTTSHTGFCQPICVREISADDHISVRTANKVFFQPMVKPTFGRLYLRNYKCFVPFEELYHPFPSLLSGKSYSGAINQYIPSDVPYSPLGVLVLYAYLCSEINVFTGTVVESVATGVDIDTPTVVTSQSTVNETVQLFFGEYGIKFGVDFSIPVDLAFQYGFCLVRNSLPEDYDPDDLFGRYDWICKYGNYLVCGRLTERGKNLRKIIIGSGYQFSLLSTNVEILSIFAYYKAWYDLFAIQRESTWKDTNAYSCLEYLEQSGTPFVTVLGEGTDPFSTRFTNFFLIDLPSCYYTQSPDYAAAHIVGTGISQKANNFSYMQPDGTIDTVLTDPGSQPFTSPANDISQAQLNVLRKMYERVNTLTAIGGRIRDIMRSIFGADYKQENESNYIGSTESVMDISQVTSMAETEKGYLGEYAGKGLGEDPSHVFEFTASRQGFFVEFFCIVPDSRLAQGLDPLKLHTSRYDFFDKKFDSITLLPSPKSSIYATYDYADDDTLNSLSSGFGNIPNYMEYKVSQDCVNGDVSMKSTRAALLPFTFAKLLPYTSVSQTGTEYHVRNVNPNIIVAGDLWRFIGLDKWLGNFDRIFVNSGKPFGGRASNAYNVMRNDLEYRLDDNFVCYFYQDLSYTGYAGAVADSFETDPFGNHLTVQKA